ncbi:hypothetical protein [Streptomyces katrae]|uniref:hypothetical protein n=1 Tax=Streptomyces katrae TaxID=68223 RepID=UPI0004C259CE|nr:hypothetical protein [Streptomyces katrae]
MPLPDYVGLDSMSVAWVYASTSVTTTDGNLSSALHNYTQGSNGEWNAAMRQFCGAVWGASGWGQSREGYEWRGRSFAVGFSLEVDEEAMNAAVEAYNNRVRRQVAELSKLHEALDEAYLSAPTFRAESARAESFGARALTDFKNDPLYTVAGDDESNHKYPIDLANLEGIIGSHVVDKQVGKTDEQLEQRLRDQQIVRPSGIRPEAVSAFGSLADA